jgi:hypothetical protein
MLEQKNVHYRARRPFVNEGPGDFFPLALLRLDFEDLTGGVAFLPLIC